ncbi:MAG: hypothetical protein H0T45_16660, partial [Pyrinomonadaceae bacterium]|nr:hypothetical protein [Pyrinomonadaceae bacterium]
MNSRKIITTLLIYLAIIAGVFAFTYWRLRVLAAGVVRELPAAEEPVERNPDVGPPKPYFSVQTNRSYGTNERARMWVNYRDIDTLDFRVYRVNEPAQFFKQLEDPHQAGENEEGIFENYWRKRQLTFLEKVRAFKNWFFYRTRRYVRGQLKRDARQGFNQRFRRDDGDAVDKEVVSSRAPLNVADYAQVPLLNEQQLDSSWREKLTPLEDEYDRQSISLGKKQPGVYVVEAVSGDLRAYGVVMVTDLAMVEKTSRDGQLLIYAVNRQSGAPRAGVEVEVLKGKQTVANGKTDNDGVLRVKVREPASATTTGGEDGEEGAGEDEGADGEETNSRFFITAREQNHFAINDLDSFYFGGGGSERNAESLTSYIYTDRPVYRPNQKVYFKGILRRQLERGYQSESGSVAVSVEDPNNARIYEQNVTLSARGTFSGEVDIPDEAPLGSYNIAVDTGNGTASSYFEVLEYKKPEYKV